MAKLLKVDKEQLNYKPKRNLSLGLTFVIIAAVLALGFLAGSRKNELMSVLGSIFNVKLATAELDLSSVQTAYQTLYNNYDGTLNTDKLVEGANRGLVEAVGDQYTIYMNQKEANEFNDYLLGNIGGGIGAEIGLRNSQIVIVRTLKDNPAEAAGLYAGDIITAINDQLTTDWSAEKAVQEIRGEVGTTVKLRILRNGEIKEFSVTRDTINNPSVESRIENNIGILTISRFDNETANLAKEAAQNFKEQNIEAVILDLRGDGGGYLSTAKDVASLWLKNKIVVVEKTGNKVVDELKSSNDAILADVPTVVLVNAGSASASEIVAGALKDHGVAKIIGDKTYGKGSVQKLIPLPKSAQLKVTVARWYTPSGKNITEEGILPDIEVNIDQDDINAGRDPQYQAALKALGL
jgi:carboxyl-terminal processing protease